ncbi:MAG: hypothetical protein M1820_002708 [Bogoriella megaspora]|nr:MAG: hypothetical protein M1820_002708 [Bogoriella megaspora]
MLHISPFRSAHRLISNSSNIVLLGSLLLPTFRSTKTLLQPRYRHSHYARLASSTTSRKPVPQQRATSTIPTKTSVQPPSIAKPSASPPIPSSLTLTTALNPPSTTLPAPLTLPTRSEYSSTLSYLYNLGRSYASFYKSGVKNTWTNYKLSRTLSSKPSSTLTRGEKLLLRRSSHDVRRLPVFAILFLIVGEWLPLFVPFVPRLVPLTCRIPKQENGMRQVQHERRRKALLEIGARDWPDSVFSQEGFGDKRRIVMLSQALGLFSAKLDALTGLPGTGWVLRRRLEGHVRFLEEDDEMLVRNLGKRGVEEAVEALGVEERVRAADDRGLDVLGKSEVDVAMVLREYLDRARMRPTKNKER